MKDLLVLQKKMRDAQNLVRKRVFTELLETERTYARNLSDMEKEVLAKITPDSELTQKDIDEMFVNLTALVKHHTQFLKLLEERAAAWSDTSIVSDLFLYHSSFLVEYKEFLTGYHRASVFIKYFKGNSKKVKCVLDTFASRRKNKTGLTFDDYFILPVQRIPRYGLLLSEIQRYTAKTDPEYESMSEAIKKIQDSLSSINNQITQEEIKICSTILEMESVVEGYSPFLLEALESKRLLVFEGSLFLAGITPKEKPKKKSKGTTSVLIKCEKNSKLHCYLCVDNFIVCSCRDTDVSRLVGGKSKSSPEKPYVFEASIPISKIQSVSLQDQKKHDEKFYLDFAQESWFVEARDKEQWSLWMLNLEHTRMRKK
eukprot:CAMPEP_0201479670 /NCGR_PEP_ID=MMETSP0151_2-20130828/4334_1 /ASSEMBLY_ACC=CAM_ASM_000257 /TAXON_ID=200890 /ORGANISM="Paramoeba atlantica, Strain 621/1 / CCAP 1560/9" /LENGTH=370 /DNA_ID=CAMNT_0047861267 /DNA_START=246 /DNA_END=1358 /DNA_ORIENTATION=-